MARRVCSVVVASVVLAMMAGCCCAASDVVQLTSANFEKMVLKSQDYWLVEFYAPWCGHCKNLAPTWEELATKVKSQARIGAVDATEHKDLASQYGIQGFPTIKAFGKDKSAPEDYQQGRDLKSLVAYVQQHAKGFGISTAVESVRYKDMYRFVAGNSKRFLLVLPDGAKKSQAPKWFGTVAGKARAKYKQLGFAVAHGADAAKIRTRLGLPKHPTVVAITADGKYAHTGAKSGATGAAFVKKFIKSDAPDDVAELPAFPEPSRPKSRTPVKLATITRDNVDKKCFSVKGRMCVLVVDGGGQGDDVAKAVARPLARAFRLDKLSFGHVPAGALGDALRASFGLPARSDGAAWVDVVVVKSGRKKRFAVAPALADADAAGVVSRVSEFLNEVVGGSVRFTKYSVPELPADSDGDDASDGAGCGGSDDGDAGMCTSPPGEDVPADTGADEPPEDVLEL